ncbi:MAG: ATP-binding protein, partial [Candidatus Omnitrophota bacterium]
EKMDKTDYLNQQPYLDIIAKRVNAIKEGYRQNVAIIGDKDIGKTSIILHFLNHFNDPMILPLYIELRPEYTKEYFVRKFIGVLLYNFLENSIIARSENLDFLISKAAKFIPKTTKEITMILNSLNRKQRGGSKNMENIFVQLLTLCDILNSETKKHCVIFFDEFHHLGTLGIKQIYKQFSKMLMIQKRVLYIISSSAKYRAKKILASHLALLFGNFEIVEVEPFNLKTTERFLSSRLNLSQIPKHLLDFLVHFIGGFPLYLNIIADALLKIPTPVTREKLAEVIQDLLFIESGLLNQRFNNYLADLQKFKAAQDYKTLLYLIADGQNRIKDIATNLHKPKSQILARLNFLIESDLIDKSGDFFVINNRAFSFWLRFVYQEKLDSLTFNTDEQKKNFRIKIENKISQFIAANQKTVLERTMELLNLFENASMQMRTKKLRLVHFQEVKALNFMRGRLSEGLLGRAKRSLWIMAINPDILTEDDIADFSKQCRRLRYRKPQKKVIITHGDIDTNVRLKAMEEKVLTWNLDDLNLVLDLYNKPRIIP